MIFAAFLTLLRDSKCVLEVEPDKLDSKVSYFSLSKLVLSSN